MIIYTNSKYFFFTFLILCSCVKKQPLDTSYVKENLWLYDSGFKIGKGSSMSFDSKLFTIQGDTIFYDYHPTALIIAVDKKNAEMYVSNITRTQNGLYVNTNYMFDSTDEINLSSFNQNQPFTITSFQKTSDYPSSDTDTTQCVHWQLNQEQISDVISGFTAINGSEWHYLFGHYPCEYSGTLMQDRQEFKFAINSGSWFHLTSDTIVYYGDLDGKFEELFLDTVWDEENYE